ncbi:hypothetical protein WOLCODRAFT_158406 [Wolfiporia cocos MD-104 SS10]|uniref:Nephrocystin 3-like N-terminal domain-containing protein n=1 Tax=Wolfiporia cocos (strain MD-104) TaxID=742152 RepID=A0A2H3JGA2_WOLCO|nr:hypothetical protein WOLCODRAFT_158406 [Wolfiporia cocos MD-104 SS10]
MSSKYRKQRRQPPTSAEVLFAIQSSLDDYMDTGSFALIPVLEQVCVALAEITERIRNVQGDEEIRGRIATSLRRLLDGVKSLSDLAGDKVQQSNRTLQLDKKIATNQQLRTTVQTLIIRLKAIDLQAGKESTLQGVSAGLTEAADGFETCSRADLEKVVEDALMGQDTEWARSHSRLSSYEKQLLQVNYDHAEWLFQHPNFKSWLHESPVLGIYGNVATGKTYLASAVVKKMLRDGDLITFCFGDMFNNETRNVSGAMRVLFSRVPGMFTGGPGFNGSADHHDRDIMTIEGALGGKDTFDVQQIVDIFSGLLHSNSLIVVVDAVDECGSGDKLLDILLGLVERARVGSQGSVKLLVTSRSGNDIIRKKMAQYLHICLDEEDRVDRATLQRQIDNALQQWPVMRDLPAELRKPLVETLTNCDHGSYRWIRRQPKAMEALKADPVKAIFNSNYTVRWMKRLSKKDAECFIEALYYWTSEMDSLPALYSNVLLRVLRKICKSYDILPQGIYLKSQDIALSEKAEYAVASGNSVVSTGRYRDKLVAD